MTLHLFLKAKWFDMVVAGGKREEYREIKPYWSKRLFTKPYKTVTFHKGYSGLTITFRIQDITVGKGNTKWGAPLCDVFIITIK